ncbi:Oxidoreductase, aldo/keto reductase family [uncultured Leptolyngbya sp.]|uniref:Oxidoreductase, aldo/keto reductase family n=1 Tax=uncultured Leptolyngbya sp. TaxID=332963 RepID=A0A6J4M0M0_9CYAN|nr:Oxidoreductase, aldo/keto reductase family [uncultured Leptolyngbya sp.]
MLAKLLGIPKQTLTKILGESMKTRTLGTQGLTVSELGLGCMGLTNYAYGKADEKESIAVIHRAIELGVTFLDTAEVYGPFTSEQLVGRAAQGRRDQVVIATKFGFAISGSTRQGLNSNPAHVHKVCDESLKRLGTDYIDLFYQHRVDPAVPIEETVGAMAALVQQGKVRYLGLSEASPNTIRRAHAVYPISALQSEYSLWERGVEAQTLPTVRELGIGFVPYSPVGRGFLTGQIKRFEDFAEDDYRRTDPRFQGENFNLNLKLVDRVKQIAQEKNAAPSQVALAWLLHQGDDIVPIPGTKRLAYLEENAGAAAIELSREVLDQLNQVASVGVTAGDRYGEAMLSMLDRS